MNFTDDCFRDSDEEIARQALGSDHAAVNGITLDNLRAKGWARLNLPERWAPFAEGNFPTPSGKCELRADSLEHLNLPAVPDFIPPRESPQSAPELAARFPLQLITPAAHAFLNTTFANEAKHLRRERAPFVEINPADAESRGIVTGDQVHLRNDRCAC